MTGRLFLTNKNAWTHSIENSDFKATGITMHAFIARSKDHCGRLRRKTYMQI